MGRTSAFVRDYDDDDDEYLDALRPLSEHYDDERVPSDDFGERPTDMINAAPPEVAPQGMEFDEYSMSWVPARKRRSSKVVFAGVNELYDNKRQSMRELLERTSSFDA
jgi:hypothetical protein